MFLTKNFFTFFVLLILVLPLTGHDLFAQIPRTISYQGVLTDNSGNPKADGNYDFTFSLYEAESGGDAIWNETKTLNITKGLFSTSLGDVNPFGAEVKFDKPYWLGIKVGNEAELPQRIALTSSAYSLNAVNVENGKVVKSINSLTDKIIIEGTGGATVTTDGNTIKIGAAGGSGSGIQGVQNTDNTFAITNPNGPTVTINLKTPLVIPAKLKVKGQDAFEIEGYQPFITLKDSSSNLARGVIQSVAGGLNLFTENYLNGSNPFGYIKLNNNGNVGIGSSQPVGKLEVVGQDAIRGIGYQPFFTLLDDNTGYARSRIQGAGGDVYLETEAYINSADPASGFFVLENGSGNVGIGTGDPQAKLDVNGTTRTKILSITGGSDLAEPFEVSEEENIEPGTVMIIDENNPGKLTISENEYDKKVAGIVSGAGGVNPGITLHQEGVLQGSTLIAISGRVYCKAEAFSEPITPGDLLTTSSLPGYVKKASDFSRMNGAVIGKAMSSLKNGKGLILVLVNLQ